ncbi:unnamed protein product [Pleuronectes platessa]|uniref:Uncharacterized protein n=1 Tax=Pleuronectes platessa TaxID=8262 RepID=A0A9N7TX21_PLEPL|nr:unnamed protein product [Pleuronectes platessa]
MVYLSTCDIQAIGSTARAADTGEFNKAWNRADVFLGAYRVTRRFSVGNALVRLMKEAMALLKARSLPRARPPEAKYNAMNHLCPVSRRWTNICWVSLLVSHFAVEKRFRRR